MRSRSSDKVCLRIRRQDGPDKLASRRWEEFEVPRFPRMSVLDALRRIAREPVTKEGKRAAPVAWDCSCLEELCGACAMNIDGVARQACGALIDDLAPKGNKPIVLEPLSKFPVVRDLVVDRSKMFEDLVRTRAWIDIDGTHVTGEGLRESVERQRVRYVISRCMMCGCCLEACPNANDSSAFMGAAVVNQVRYFSLHPSASDSRAERLDSVMGRGGVADCGKAQVCGEVCPMGIPLVESISYVARDTTKRLVFGWLLG